MILIYTQNVQMQLETNKKNKQKLFHNINILLLLVIFGITINFFIGYLIEAIKLTNYKKPIQYFVFMIFFLLIAVMFFLLKINENMVELWNFLQNTNLKEPILKILLPKSILDTDKYNDTELREHIEKLQKIQADNLAENTTKLTQLIFAKENSLEKKIQTQNNIYNNQMLSYENILKDYENKANNLDSIYQVQISTNEENIINNVRQLNNHDENLANNNIQINKIQTHNQSQDVLINDHRILIDKNTIKSLANEKKLQEQGEDNTQTFINHSEKIFENKKKNDLQDISLEKHKEQINENIIGIHENIIKIITNKEQNDSQDLLLEEHNQQINKNIDQINKNTNIISLNTVQIQKNKTNSETNSNNLTDLENRNNQTFIEHNQRITDNSIQSELNNTMIEETIAVNTKQDGLLMNKAQIPALNFNLTFLEQEREIGTMNSYHNLLNFTTCPDINYLENRSETSHNYSINGLLWEIYDKFLSDQGKIKTQYLEDNCRKIKKILMTEPCYYALYNEYNSLTPEEQSILDNNPSNNKKTFDEFIEAREKFTNDNKQLLEQMNNVSEIITDYNKHKEQEVDNLQQIFTQFLNYDIDHQPSSTNTLMYPLPNIFHSYISESIFRPNIGIRSKKMI